MINELQNVYKNEKESIKLKWVLYVTIAIGFALYHLGYEIGKLLAIHF